MGFTVPANKSELACSLACLVLFDKEDAVPITAENIVTVLKSANCFDGVEPYWPAQFANLLKDQDVSKMILAGGGGGAAAPAAAAAGGETAAAAEEVVEEEEEEEEEEEDMGFSLFD